MAEPLDSLVAAYHLLAADFALAAASHRPDYSIDGVSVSRDQWLDRMLSKLKALREEIDVPIHFHTHDTSGINAGSILRAADAGVDIADAAIASMSGMTSQPSLNGIVAALRHTERDTGLSLQAALAKVDALRVESKLPWVRARP